MSLLLKVGMNSRFKPLFFQKPKILCKTEMIHTFQHFAEESSKSIGAQIRLGISKTLFSPYIQSVIAVDSAIFHQ